MAVSQSATTTETQIIADSPTYGTRQSNKRIGDGGGPIYGCRSALPNESVLVDQADDTAHRADFHLQVVC